MNSSDYATVWILLILCSFCITCQYLHKIDEPKRERLYQCAQVCPDDTIAELDRNWRCICSRPTIQ